MILNTEKLSGENQEKILSFLSCQGIFSRGINIHCIQSANTILHTSPWVEGRLWDNDAISTIASNDDADWFKRKILDRIHVEQVSIVASSSCGSGKTRFVSDELSRLKCENQNTQIASVNIHEGTSLASLVKSLSSKFLHCDQKAAVHFSLTCTQYEPKWMEMVNNFFFSLLVLRTVHDPGSVSSFHLGPNHWRFFIEIQSVPSNQSPTEWLRSSMPLLFYCGSISFPPREYFIDPKTRRICTYLRAFDNGTIDRKFCSYKRVLFLLDESGSMEIEIDGTKNALDIATDNALSIFDNHIQVDDVSNFNSQEFIYNDF